MPLPEFLSEESEPKLVELFSGRMSTEAVTHFGYAELVKSEASLFVWNSALGRTDPAGRNITVFFFDSSMWRLLGLRSSRSVVGIFRVLWRRTIAALAPSRKRWPNTNEFSWRPVLGEGGRNTEEKVDLCTQ